MNLNFFGRVKKILSRGGGPVMQEIATTQDGRDITRGYVPNEFILPPQDKILQLNGGNYETYADILQDDQVASCFQQRRRAVVSKNWEVQPGGTARTDVKAADCLREYLPHISFDRATDKMLFGVFYGYSVAENIYVRDGQQIALDAVKVRNRIRFGFDIDFQLRLITLQAPNGEVMPARKFWMFHTGADHDDEPYGIGLAHWLYWPVFFKRNGFKFWLIFLEKFGMPTAVGKYSANAKDPEKKKLLQAARAVQTDSGVILPMGMSLELLEASRSGTVDYATMFDRMQGIIAKVILSQTMTTDDGSSRAQAQVHEGVFIDVADSDSDLVCESFANQTGTWLTQWNFPGAKPPKVRRILDTPEDLSKRSERDFRVFQMGFQPTPAHVEDVYGGEWELRGGAGTADDDETPPAEFAEFAESDGDVVSRYAARLEKRMKKIMPELTAPIRRLVMGAGSWGEIREKLFGLYGELDAGAFIDAMQQAMTAAELAGRHEVLTEDVSADFAEPMPMFGYGRLPFPEAIEFFKNKINFPTKRWDDLWAEMHDPGFMVAGAEKADLLSDFREAVERAVTAGVTLRQFRMDFDEIVTKYGWDYNGSSKGRSRVLYHTNLRQSYSAGRERQMADPELRKRRPYGLYRQGFSTVPRPEHTAWDHYVPPLDHPWRDTHTPMNGWGCTCRKYSLSKRDMQRKGLKIAQNVDMSTHGIDKGFEYKPGMNDIAKLKQHLNAKADGLPDELAKQLRADLEKIK